MMAPPQRWKPATCRLTCHGQDPGEAIWPLEALLVFMPLPQSEGKTAIRGHILLGENKDFTSRFKRGQKRSSFFGGYIKKVK